MDWSLIIGTCVVAILVFLLFFLLGYRKKTTKKERNELLKLGGTCEKTVEILNKSIAEKKKEREQYREAYEKYEKLDDEIFDLETKIEKLKPEKIRFVFRF